MQFELTTDWLIPAPITDVWTALNAPEDWPHWWRFVRAVEQIEPGDADGVGALRRFTWSSRLPYSLTFAMRVTRVESQTLLEGRAEGELSGMGRWTLSQQSQGTAVRYDWRVDVTRAWMRLLAPLISPAFRWNHGAVMAEGEIGLTRYLRHRAAPLTAEATP